MEKGVKKNGLYVLLFVNINIKGSESIKKEQEVSACSISGPGILKY
jgi:hypothetical protein